MEFVRNLEFEQGGWRSGVISRVSVVVSMAKRRNGEGDRPGAASPME